MLFSRKKFFDSSGRQANKVLKIDSVIRERGRKSQIFLHKIEAAGTHQRRQTSKHERNDSLSSSRYSNIFKRQSVGS